jgi:hypothetical protein
LRSLGIPSRNDGRNWRSCSWKTSLHTYDGEIWVDPAAFLGLGAACLNELAEIVDVRPVREENVCCALVPHKAKEGSQWWKICGGTGSHTHQGQNSCGRHQLYYRAQEKTGKVPIFTTDTAACSSHYGLGIFHCLSEAHLGKSLNQSGQSTGRARSWLVLSFWQRLAE